MEGVKRREGFPFRERQYQLKRQRRGSHIENAAGNIVHHFLQSSQRKEMEMRFIEDATVRRVEISKEQFETNHPVRDIRYRDDDFA